MSHSKHLIEKIAAIIAIEFPSEAGYLYIFEKKLGQGAMPDIVVKLGERVLCAVEIGYTRPEKLTAYREQYNIPDVRWYDRSGRLQFQWSCANPGRAYQPLPTHVHSSRFGTTRVYVRRHFKGCVFTRSNQLHCACPKWIYSRPRLGEQKMRSAHTPDLIEACQIAQEILQGFDTGAGPPLPESKAQAFRWYHSDVIRPRREKNPYDERERQRVEQNIAEAS